MRVGSDNPLFAPMSPSVVILFRASPSSYQHQLCWDHSHGLCTETISRRRTDLVGLMSLYLDYSCEYELQYMNSYRLPFSLTRMSPFFQILRNSNWIIYLHYSKLLPLTGCVNLISVANQNSGLDVMNALVMCCTKQSIIIFFYVVIKYIGVAWCRTGREGNTF